MGALILLLGVTFVGSFLGTMAYHVYYRRTP
jgi:hypothetical protein